jgi:hypothetical protein
MAKRKYLLLLAVAVIAAAGCRGEKKASTEPETFQFTIYPGSRYLQQVTEVFKQASKVIRRPDEEIPPTAVYDTDASVEDVAQFYAKAYGYPNIAPDASNNLSSVKPPAYYRSGDLAADVKGVSDLFTKLNLKVDTSKAVGTYRAAEIQGKPTRPHVTIQRPYFDVTTSQVVDRTIILMAR